MQENILVKTYEIKKMIDDNDYLLRLTNIEKDLKNNKEVIKLSQLKDIALSRYNEGLSYYSKDSEDLERLRLDFVNAKKDLFEHPLVKEYNELYSKVRLMYMNLNDIIFGNFNINLCPNKKI